MNNKIELDIRSVQTQDLTLMQVIDQICDDQDFIIEDWDLVHL